MLNTSASTLVRPSSMPPQAERVHGAGRPANGKPEVDANEKGFRSVREEQNLRILQSSAEVSLKSGDQSQALLLRTAIDRINGLLEPTLGPDAIQAKMGEDNSPEGTAGRIVSLSTGFFEAYAAQRADDDPEQVAKDFIDLIRGGFEQGFNEAKDILQGLKVFGGEVESGIMKTYELVNKGYDDFLASKLGSSKPEAGEDAAVADKDVLQSV